MSFDAWKKATFVPYNDRKKILLLSDDLRLPSGVGTMSKHIIENSLHHFHWVQLGAAIKHPEMGKVVDMSTEFSNRYGIGENYMKVYPCSGYGNADIVRAIINQEKPDAILHFTDPRQWLWLYMMENELREHLPILFYHIWDDLPFPQYNESYYESCDWISSISKQTYNIVRNVMQRQPLESWQTKYIPHGIDSTLFKPVTFESPGKQIEYKDSKGNKMYKTEFEEMMEFKKKLFNDKSYDYVLFYNNRNIRRKMAGDVILAYKTFCDRIGKKKAEKCLLLMHTAVVDDNGTDLGAVKDAIAPDCNIQFSTAKLEQRFLNYLYNLSDTFINIASNEGFGLTTAEALMAGTPIIASVTGGLQDQMGFLTDEDELIDPEKHLTSEWSSNHDARYKRHGEWVLPVFPKTRSLVGSPPTPYIFDDRVDWQDVSERILEMYEMDSAERLRRGLLGREYLCNPKVKMEVNHMAEGFVEGIDEVFKHWKPVDNVSLTNVTKYEMPQYPVGITLNSEYIIK